jgi:hypothetical protein
VGPEHLTTPSHHAAAAPMLTPATNRTALASKSFRTASFALVMPAVREPAASTANGGDPSDRQPLRPEPTIVAVRAAWRPPDGLGAIMIPSKPRKPRSVLIHLIALQRAPEGDACRTLTDLRALPRLWRHRSRVGPGPCPPQRVLHEEHGRSAPGDRNFSTGITGISCDLSNLTLL